MSKYRFKTKEEFVRDGLWRENCPYLWNSSGKMNKYLGQDIPEEFNDKCDKGVGFDYEDWSFSSNDYVLKENYVGRTIKALVDSPNLTGVKKGEQIKIIEIASKQYSLDKTNEGIKGMRIDYPLNLSHWELLPEINTKTPVDMKAIQEEAKKRFPIGCRFKNTNGNSYTLKKDNYVYEIHGKSIWAHEYSGCLYQDGKWAELISLPEIVSINEFKKGDYIVTLNVENGYNCAKRNYCFKQRVNSTGMAPEVDLKGSTTNSHGAMSFGKAQLLKNWRYATPEEIAEYDRIGKPYDVTTLQKKEEYIPQVGDYVVMESKSPLEICRQKYKKGMVVMSAKDSGIYSGIFTINVDPEEFHITGEEIDYFGSEGFLYCHGKYAEILSYPDEQSKIEYSNSEDSVLNKISIQKETFIENVQSVDIDLVVKKKRIIF